VQRRWVIALMAAWLAGCAGVSHSALSSWPKGPDKTTVMMAEWAAPGALTLPSAYGARLAWGSVFGKYADATYLTGVFGAGREGDDTVVTIGVEASLGLEMLTLLLAKPAPDWSTNISPMMAVGLGAVWGEADDRGFGAYVELEVGVTVKVGEIGLLQTGYRGTLFAAEEAGGAAGGFVRAGFTF